MINKSYKISSEELHVICMIDDYDDIIKKRMSMFECIQTNKRAENFIKIYKDKTIYCYGNKNNIIIGKLLHTDLYPLFNNLIANILIKEKKFLLHSCVLCYNNVGFLVVGDFNIGKTTLCLEAEKSNMTISSTDQTILHIIKNNLYVVKGSKYLRIRKSEDCIRENQISNIKIKYILNLVGMCEGGKTSFEVVDDKNNMVKTIFKFLTWHSDIPLFTDNSLLEIDRTLIKKWLFTLKVPMVNVRGNSKSIIKEIKEVIK